MRVRLILSFIVVVLVAIASVLLIARQSTLREVGRYMTRSSMGLDETASELEQYYQQFGTWQGADQILLLTRQGRGMGQGMMMNRPHLRLADATGTVVADTAQEPGGELTRSERDAAILLQNSRGQRIGYLLAEVTGNMMSSAVQAGEQQLLNRLVQAALIAGLVAGGLALLLALVLSYGLLKPVQDLTDAASKMAHGDLSQRVNVKRRDELGTLGSAFNQMASSLQRAEHNRRAMTADIAHELRTPIAVQRAHLEALQDGVYPLKIENLQPILDQTELLTRLVEDLRTLALADAGELKLERSSIDLGQLLRRTVERFRPEAENRGVRITFEEPSPGDQKRISVDPGRVEQIINNLISNALRYTPEDSTVRVVLDWKNNWAEINVIDTGPGIPPEAQERIFERFYRADPSRSREQGGTGLGLAIARQLAIAHGGSLKAANQAGGGAVFTLRLPSGYPDPGPTGK